MNAYSPRRQSKQWLDGDCPREILAIYYDKREPSDPYTIFYTCVEGSGLNRSLTYVGADESGRGFHGELRIADAAAFRYRNSHRACKWSEVHKPVRDWIIADIKRWKEDEARDNERLDEIETAETNADGDRYDETPVQSIFPDIPDN